MGADTGRKSWPNVLLNFSLIPNVFPVLPKLPLKPSSTGAGLVLPSGKGHAASSSSFFLASARNTPHNRRAEGTSPVDQRSEQSSTQSSSRGGTTAMCTKRRAGGARWVAAALCGDTTVCFGQQREGEVLKQQFCQATTRPHGPGPARRTTEGRKEQAPSTSGPSTVRRRVRPEEENRDVQQKACRGARGGSQPLSVGTCHRLV